MQFERPLHYNANLKLNKEGEYGLSKILPRKRGLSF